MTRASFTAQWRRRFCRARHGDHDGVGTVGVAVGLVLAEYADWATGENARPGLDRVADVVGCSTATVKRGIKMLVISGWIECTDRGSFGRASTYRLTIPPLVDTSSGEIHAPLTGARVIPWTRPGRDRNGLTGERVTGARVSHHLCHDLFGGRVGARRAA